MCLLNPCRPVTPRELGIVAHPARDGPLVNSKPATRRKLRIALSNQVEQPLLDGGTLRVCHWPVPARYEEISNAENQVGRRQSSAATN
jgi:hypothetical protein